MLVGAKIRAEMHRRGLTQIELSKATGVAQSQISRICSGQALRHSRGVIQICAYLNISTGLPPEQPLDPSSRRLILSVIDEICQDSSLRRQQVVKVLELIREISLKGTRSE